jgi:hypothetical protein
VIEVVVVGEGQTEETFVRDVLAPAFWAQDISLQPRLMRTSSEGRGGALSRDRVLRHLRNTLRERSDTYVTTFFDLYGLNADVPGVKAAAGLADPLQRAGAVERGLAAAVIESAGCRGDRFIAHIQPHEFEALLFADVDRLLELRSTWQAQGDALRKARLDARSPEHVNDGKLTHPSARLARLQPRYAKVQDGPLLASAIGLDRIRAECAHFRSWLERLEALRPL